MPLGLGSSLDPPEADGTAPLEVILVRSDAQRLAILVAVLIGALVACAGGLLVLLGIGSAVAGSAPATPAALASAAEAHLAGEKVYE